MKNPNVAAELSMNCDSVPSAPLGPGPARRIWIPPPMKPIVSPTRVPVIAPILTVQRNKKRHRLAGKKPERGRKGRGVRTYSFERQSVRRLEFLAFEAEAAL